MDAVLSLGYNFGKTATAKDKWAHILLLGLSYTYCVTMCRIVSLRWKLRGVVLAEQDRCSTVTYEMRNASNSDDGEYICEMTFTNRTTISKSAGTLRVVGELALITEPL